jgi:predicted Zn-dependent protease
MTRQAAAAMFELSEAFVTELEAAVPIDTLFLLMRSAYLAIERGQLDEADTLANGLLPFEPWYPEVAILIATVAVATNRPAEGLALLDRLIAKRPGLNSAVCACAMLKKDLGLSDWRALAQRVVDSPDADASSLQAARSLLDLPAAAPPKTQAARSAAAYPAGLRFVR